MGLHVVAAAACDAPDRVLEPPVLERLDLAALAAHEVVVMISTRVGRLEPGGSVAEVHPLDQTERGEAVERPVHARDPDTRSRCSHAVVDLLGREAAILPAEELDDLTPRSAAPAARCAETSERALDPRLLHRW